MKRYNSTLIKMTRRLGMAIAALLMLSTMASCSDQDSQAPATGDEAYLNLSFSTASATTSRASRAGDIGKDDETQANPNAESDIHSIKVWVFKSGTGEKANPIAYKEDRPTAVGGVTANGTYTLNLRFLRKINGEEIKNIDLYILANSESTNMADKLNGKDFRSITREDLQGVTFDKPFGITKDGKAETTEVPNGKAQTTEVPNGKGLPISRAITNIAIAGHVADTEIKAKEIGIKIPLVRAVSKLHFYFARKDAADAMTENVKVTRIEIDGYTFPTESYVFPDEEDFATADANKAATSNKYGTSYVASPLKLDGVENTGIKEVTDPLTYVRGETETAQVYMDRMNKEIGGHNLSYLRETNKPIKGKIYYQLAEGGSEKFREFTIPSEDKAIRNRELVVYGYFLQGGALCLDWQVMPWNVVTSEIGWNGANCQMFAWHKTSPSATSGDAEGLYCLVNYPRYKESDETHNSLEDKQSGAAFYFKVESPTGLVWKAHLTNTDDFAFNYGKSTESTTCVSTGIARTAPYQIKVEAKNAWTTNASWDQLTPWAIGKGTNPVYTDLYVTVSLDGIHEYEVEINPDKAGGRYKKGRKFAGTNTRIRIFQLQAIKDKGYDDLQKESGHYTNYLE